MSKHAEMDEKQTTLLFIRAKRGGRHLGIGSDLIVGMKNLKYIFQDAEMAELVDAIDSKSIDRKVMRVRVPLSAQIINSRAGNFFVLRKGLERRSATARVEVERFFSRKILVT